MANFSSHRDRRLHLLQVINIIVDRYPKSLPLEVDNIQVSDGDWPLGCQSNGGTIRLVWLTLGFELVVLSGHL